ncbi:MAG: NUDIX domain-containing protein [Runella slithyformis]|nr:MAG: NUDIX domain-containing protein [Runella slithyformis]
MKRQPLLTLLRHYLPIDATERQMWQDTLVFVETQPHCFERWLLPGHITGSAWIIDPTRQCALLMHHRKLDRWFQPGGHADGATDVRQVAFKEATEETGLAAIQPIGTTIFDIDVHLIPARPEMPAHLHYDIRFLFEANASVPLLGNHESKAVRWIQLEEIENYNNSDSILRMVNKVLKMRDLQ